MENTHTYRLISLKKSNGVYLNIVKSVVIEVTASDGSNSLSHNYSAIFEEPVDDINNSFIEYNDLTEAQIIGWFKNNIEHDFAKKDIDRRLKESLQDTVESNFPWS